MRQNRETRTTGLIAVATRNWRERLAEGFQRAYHQFHWCEDVYSAVAAAVEWVRQDKQGFVVVMVDCLTSEEMSIFSVLAGLPGIRSVAVSSKAARDKLDQARRRGADMATAIDELSELGELLQQAGQDRLGEETPATPREEETGEPVRPVEQSVTREQDISSMPDAVIEREVEQDLVQTQDWKIEEEDSAEKDGDRTEASGVTKREPARIPRRRPPGPTEVERPLLTQEELDALLG